MEPGNAKPSPLVIFQREGKNRENPGKKDKRDSNLNYTPLLSFVKNVENDDIVLHYLCWTINVVVYIM